LRTVKNDSATLARLIEIVHLRLAEFAAELELVSALGPGQGFVEVARNVVAP